MAKELNYRYSWVPTSVTLRVFAQTINTTKINDEDVWCVAAKRGSKKSVHEMAERQRGRVTGSKQGGLPL